MKPNADVRARCRARRAWKWLQEALGGLFALGIVLALVSTAQAQGKAGTRQLEKEVQQLQEAAKTLSTRCHANDKEWEIEKAAITRGIDGWYDRTISEHEERMKDLASRRSGLPDTLGQGGRNQTPTPNPAAPALETEIRSMSDKITALRTERSKALPTVVDELKKQYDPAGPLCKSLCSDVQDAKTPHETPIQFCKLTDPALASAAVIADLASVRALTAFAIAPELALAKALGFDPLARQGRPDILERAALPAAAVPQGLDITAASLRTAEVALAALAKVVVDRAKRESLIWFLEEMHDNVCGKDTKDPCDGKPEGDSCFKDKDYRSYLGRQEIRSYWLPATCGLAGKTSDYTQYGGGAELLGALQGAIASDVRRWPGTAAGLGAGAVFWTATPLDKPQNKDLKELFACDPQRGKTEGLCVPAVGLRRATAKLVDQLQNGANASASLYAYSSEVDDLNKERAQGAVVDLHNDALEVAACAMALPMVFQEYGEAVRQLTPGRAEQAEALLLAGLASAPACWSITGTGWDKDQCPAFSSSGTAGQAACKPGAKPENALTSTHRLERLTTILRWHAHVHDPAARVIAQWGAVQTAWEAYKAALDAVVKKGGDSVFTAPALNIGAVNDSSNLEGVLKALDAHVKEAARSAQQSELVKLLQASAALARASLDLGVAVTAGLGSVTSPKLYPGLCQDPSSDCGAVSKALQKTSEILTQYSGYVSTAENALTQDWGAAVANVVASLRGIVTAKCAEDVACKALVDRLSRYSGLFSALVSAKDPDTVAKALDAAAMPIGGWRNKQVEDTFMMSVGSFAGVGLACELRWGQYGVTRNQGEHGYFAAPTLVLPVGLDLSWALNNSVVPAGGLFLSVLDPAAYLQYDVEQQGRVPGPQVITALAPGVAGHVSLGKSPFVLSGYVMFRPNFRAWDPEVVAPAANVLQFGGSVAVDVTLFDLYTRRSE